MHSNGTMQGMTSTSWAPPLNDQLGLDPGLTGLAKLWSDRKLAIVRGVGYPVSASGFDLHANEKDAQTGRLTGFDKAVTAFRSALAGSARERDVVLMAYSKFGRRVRANASEGTDPGTVGPVLLIGDSVTAGFHGDEPSRTDLGDGDLMTSTDFRAVYGEVLDRML